MLRPAAFVACTVMVFAVASAGVTARSHHARPQAGMFLVASPEMSDPRFVRTVILITAHSDEGSHGLVVNRRTDLTLSDLFPALDSNRTSRYPVYLGGPVARHQLACLYRTRDRPAGGRAVLEDVHVTEDPELLLQLVEEGDHTLRAFFGYAGWAPGQLQFELWHGSWELAPARVEDVFRSDGERLWQELSSKRRGLLTRLASPAPV